MASRHADHTLSPNLFDLDAEQAVVGSLMLDGDAIHRVASILQPEDFYRGRHGQVYRAALTLLRAGRPIDLVTLSDELEREGLLAQVGGRSHLAELQERTPTATNVADYANIVRERAEARRELRRLEGQAEAIRQGHGHVSTGAGVARQDGRFMSEVAPEVVDWLWYGRLARGKVTMIDGDPGQGKSVLTLDMAARVTTGTPWPDGAPCAAGGVVLLTAEDGAADTIRPRLDIAGADSSRVLNLDQVGADKHPVVLPDDLTHVRAAIERVRREAAVEARLLIVDPLSAFLNGEVNMHRDQDVRRALRPLKDMAEQTGVAVAVVRHLNKSQGAPVLYRGGGSIGIIGAARIGLVVGGDPDNDRRHVLALAKMNLTPRLPSLAYVIEDASGVARLSWDGVTDLNAEQIVAACSEDAPERKSALADATCFLADLLAAGPVAAQQVKAAAEQTNIRWPTIRRAKDSLGIKVVKVGGASAVGEAGDQHAHWEWMLPAGRCPDRSEGARPAEWAPSMSIERLPAASALRKRGPENQVCSRMEPTGDAFCCGLPAIGGFHVQEDADDDDPSLWTQAR